MRLFTTIIFAPVAISAATPADATPLWQLILRNEMMAEEHCQTENFSNIVELENGGRITLTAEVHCRDGRRFHVQWNLEERRFDVDSPAALPADAGPVTGRR